MDDAFLYHHINSYCSSFTHVPMVARIKQLFVLFVSSAEHRCSASLNMSVAFILPVYPSERVPFPLTSEIEKQLLFEGETSFLSVGVSFEENNFSIFSSISYLIFVSGRKKVAIMNSIMKQFFVYSNC